MNSKFRRENRYIVVKHRKLDDQQLNAIKVTFEMYDIEQLKKAVVVESDWPEYETVWAMIEARCTGKVRPETTASDDVKIEQREIDGLVKRLLRTEKKRLRYGGPPTERDYHQVPVNPDGFAAVSMIHRLSALRPETTASDDVVEAMAELKAKNYETFTDGLEAGAQICGSLAETTYDDADAFEAATGCEAAIMAVVRAQRKEQRAARGGE